jgi:hypothetical protein
MTARYTALSQPATSDILLPLDVDANGIFDIEDIAVITTNYRQLELSGDNPYEHTARPIIAITLFLLAVLLIVVGASLYRQNRAEQNTPSSSTQDGLVQENRSPQSPAILSLKPTDNPLTYTLVIDQLAEPVNGIAFKLSFPKNLSGSGLRVAFSSELADSGWSSLINSVALTNTTAELTFSALYLNAVPPLPKSTIELGTITFLEEPDLSLVELTGTKNVVTYSSSDSEDGAVSAPLYLMLNQEVVPAMEESGQ